MTIISIIPHPENAGWGHSVLTDLPLSFKGAAIFLVAASHFKHKLDHVYGIPLSLITSGLRLSHRNFSEKSLNQKEFVNIDIGSASGLDIPQTEVTESTFDSHIVACLPSLVQKKDFETLHKLGGQAGLASRLHTDLTEGLTVINCPPDLKFSNPNISARKKTFGENAYPRKRGKSLLAFLWEASTDFTLIILMCCAALSLGIGIKTEGIKQGWYDGASIAFAVVLVILVTAFSNFKQSRQFEKLAQKRTDIQVRVVRNGDKISVPIRDVLVGDIVHLSIGDQVPADGLFVHGHSIAIDESSLTGESEYYYPHPKTQPFLHSGSTVQDGYGSMLVTSVGVNTEWGHMMTLLSTEGTSSEPTPLQERLTKLATLIGYVGLSVATLVLVVLLVFYFTGHSEIGSAPKFQPGVTSAADIMNALVHIFSIVITIIVVAVPEGLPLAVTLTLAYSMRKMMADNALVRRLAACETMGSATIICSDKTGTLTMNKMTVVKSWVAGKQTNFNSQEDASKMTKTSLPTQIENLLFQGISQNTTASVSKVSKPTASVKAAASNRISKVMDIVGSPTEKAILRWGLDCGMNFHAVRAESTVEHVQPFNSTKKRGGVVVRMMNDGKVIVHWKGAAEIILSMCNKWVDIDDNASIEKPMSDAKRLELQSLIETMASSSLRCLAFAFSDISEHVIQSGQCILPEENLTLLAVVGLKDPCRPGVQSAVGTVKKAGVKVMMVTGDNLATAKAIAKECGILDSYHSHVVAVEGSTLRNWTDSERCEKLSNVSVVARALPSDKLLIVETLRSMGEVVAVTGDGTNDAPALHNADIGLSMGIEGTEVAKESSDIVILDDNFTSIVNVVRWGRSIYFNIQKFLQFQLTVNVAALIINFVAAVTSGDVPLTAVQLLWVNLIMDTLGALALATESPTNELLQKPPVGRKEHLVTKTMWKNIVFQAAYQVIILLTLQFSGVKILGLSAKTDAEMINRTIIFNTFVLCQLFNEVNARQPYRLNIFHGLLRNRIFIGIVAATLVLQIVMVEFLEKFAATVQLDWQHWLVCIGLAFFSWPVGFLAKFIPVDNIRIVENDIKHQELHNTYQEV